MATVPEVATALQTVLTTTANRAARATGCIKRRRKLRGATLVQTLVFGWLAHPDATLDQLCQTAAALGVTIRPQGLDQHFTAATAACLQQVLEAAVTQTIAADPAAGALLQRFTVVYVLDSTTIRLPDALAAVWQGCGGRTTTGTTAAVKLQVGLDLRHGTLDGPYLAHGRAQDRAAPTQTAPLPPGALRIADLGFFDLAVLGRYAAAGVYWLTRLRAGTLLWDAQGRRWDVGALLAAQDPTQTELDLPVGVGAQARLAARLLAMRVPAAVAAERRRKLHTEARRKGQRVSAARLALADWTLYITNAPAALLALPEALVLGRARWQVERVFAWWKTDAAVDASRSAKPWRQLCEVYAKLLAVVVQQWLVLTTGWAAPDRSLHKLGQTVRAHGVAIAAAMRHRRRLVGALTTLARCLPHAGRVNPCRKAPATWQLLLQPHVQSLS